MSHLATVEWAASRHRLVIHDQPTKIDLVIPLEGRPRAELTVMGRKIAEALPQNTRPPLSTREAIRRANETPTLPCATPGAQGPCGYIGTPIVPGRMDYPKKYRGRPGVERGVGR